MKLAHLTDLHLDHVGLPLVEGFLDKLATVVADAFVVTGDVGEADNFASYLKLMAEKVQGRKVYFVLGNHDFYGGSIAEARRNAIALREGIPNLVYLPAAGVVPLDDNVCLIGHDGWYDGRYGNYHMSHVLLNDFGHINDFTLSGGFGQHPEDRLRMMQTLGDEAAQHFMSALPQALNDFQHVIVATHVPPFSEACLYQGQRTTGDYLPFMACKAVGDVLLRVMDANPGKRMTVLCGHTHGACSLGVLDNLRVIVGGAAYGSPRVGAVLEL